MDHYIVSARKYRPTHFNEVVGQSAITKTLENAIENNHLAQALLFTGPRGVGKTTCARILAKKINDDGTHHEDEDFAFNIFELDAASNNSVDDIRSLIDQVRIPPQVGHYKVYIIDEVHMLSSSAFNAFLKTLEEPPKHAIFILATTEKHKIIPTILSRCQIFDFKRITVSDIKQQLGEVAKSEGIDAEDDALHIIAQKADGAMRDALSIFDRVVSFSGKNLTRQAVTENLNVLDYSFYFEVTEMLMANDIPSTLNFYDAILAKGFDGQHFISGLASHFRDLLVAKNKETISLLEVGEQVKQLYLEQSQKIEQSILLDAIDLTNSCDLKYKTSRNQRLLVELCLMQLASLTFQGEKKKHSSKPFVIPPSHFKVPKNPLKESGDPKPEEVPVVKSPPIEDSEPINPIPKVIERPQILAERNASKVSALSLKSIQKKQELQKELVAQHLTGEVLPLEDFSEDAFLKVWKNYVQEIEKEGKFNLLSHLTMGEPKLEGQLIHLVFPNNTIKVEVESAKNDLVSYLRAHLKNHQIDLSIEVNEAEVKRYAYQPHEKYELLKEKNPLIDTLRREFDLDI
ncbi:MAG TPA: DNA polymerase III subunit gamma/tau [Flavobacteriaceae bacterium]|nr:DNA polymerase III subunit gamma/tau [Flavobacteriaceae bacterium]MCB9213331.1 DNA polymerase III subunit gamma/tau [Alteromonas sp.]HPF10221.1 DNA polymerase III subunit gamma/tau [Flavobacteriaceae bacterium]HQU20667.1 DNA polymerase III subunit gamma/tau [Flavobacteriaceae bacterium]HQU64915.1 DNA polymerase III subunit gamma/tau [Flavobacteriaceae bacterium]